jgi:hypothetical protein
MTSASGYQYSETECHVEDREKLSVFRAKRTEWLRLLDGDEVHSVSQQVSAMLWNDVAFRCFNEARRYAQEGEPTASLSGTLAEFLDTGYVATQTLAISKLVERNNEKQPSKAVISLRRVVDDVVSHRELFTREIFVSFDGLPYDPEPAKQRHFESLPREGKPRVTWLNTSGPEAWGTSETLHKVFDRLGGIRAGQRSRTDTISVSTMERLNAVLDRPVFATILMLRHKLIAHAADENNRPAQLANASLDVIEEAHRALTTLAHTVGATILYAAGSGGLPIPQFDQFENLDCVFLRPSDKDRLHGFWNECARKRDNWLSSAESEVL